ncbi:hypothetical protein TNCT_442561 [Trichonephila clavata]|uniref:Uncharacterized protein n=1 Tax=Trichonephila clavata TaxID=2740835 RepID=A0A8X6FYD3_TRICU|nr:hypothetical protein TNCT_442561 [Trichonephila clavata]
MLDVDICVVDDDVIFYDLIIGLNVLMKGETRIDKNGVTIKNKPKCYEEVATLSVLPINLSPDGFEINTATELPQQNLPLFECITEEPGEHIVSVNEELPLEICLNDLEEDNPCIPLKNACPILVVPESIPKEIKRSTPEKKPSRIKGNKDYHFLSRLRKKKEENSIANYDHRVLINH